MENYIEQVSPPTIITNTATTKPPTPLPTVEYPSDADFIQIAWFYKPPAAEYYYQVAQDFDVFILTHHDEVERDEMRASGLTTPIYQYLLLAEIQDPGSCTESPNGDQVAYMPGDFCRISNEHPEWFLLDQYGRRITNGDNYYYMDPGNKEFRDFWLERAREIQDEYQWDGLFLDNVEASLSKYQHQLLKPSQYPSDSSLQSAVEGFLKYLDQNYIKPENKPVIGNIISIRDPEVWFRYLQYMDGAMLEDFAVDWRGYNSKDTWEEQISMLVQTQLMGKSALLVAQGTKDDLPRQQFSFASYLLLTDGNTSFRYANYDAYREVWWYENYDLQLGRPMGTFYIKDDVWMRDFEYGQIRVDPGDHTGQIMVQP